jgi:hypothetical protein
MAPAKRKGQPAPVKVAKPLAEPVVTQEIHAVQEAPAAVVEPICKASIEVIETTAVPTVATITIDAWAEQTRRDLNTFVGCQRIARIQGGDAVRAAQPGEWLERFEAWKIAANV